MYSTIQRRKEMYSGMATGSIAGNTYLLSLVDNKAVTSYGLVTIGFNGGTFFAFLHANIIEQSVKRHCSNTYYHWMTFQWILSEQSRFGVGCSSRYFSIFLFKSIFFRLSLFRFFSIIFYSQIPPSCPSVMGTKSVNFVF